MTMKIPDIFDDETKKALIDGLKNAKNKKEMDELIKVVSNSSANNLTSGGSDIISNMTTDYQQQTMFKEVMLFRAQDQRHLAVLDQAWATAYVTSEAMYIMTLDAANEYIHRVKDILKQKNKQLSYTFIALQYIHARTLQQFLEVTTLIKNGLADGAIARWRSMYGLVIKASFIRTHGEEVAKAFIASAATDDRYEWARASNIFSSTKKNIHFNDVQKNCGIDVDQWKEPYNLANKIIHASAQRLLGTYQHEEVPALTAGRTAYGAPVPAELSALSLSQVTTLFFSVYPCNHSTVSTKYIENWIDVLRKAYFKTHDIFSRTKKISGTST